MADKEYKASDISVLSDRDHVRLRTAIYLGSTETSTFEIPIFKKDDLEIKYVDFIPALYKSFNEISDNGIDELVQLKKKDKRLSIMHDTVENKFKICDNGRGVPVDVHPQTGRHTPETVFTELRSGRNFDDGAKDSGVIGTNGVGSSCVAMISEEFNVQIRRDNKFYQQTYRDGTASIEEPQIATMASKETGTCIEFKFDRALKQFADTNLNPDLIYNRAFEIALTNPEIEIGYVRKQLDEDGTLEQVQDTFAFKGGMAEYIKKISERFFEFKYDHEDFTARYYVVLDKYQGIDEKVFVYVNSSLLFEGGTAAHMFFNTFFSQVVDKLKSETKKRKVDLNRNDVRQNMLVVADVKMKNPRYDNQSKTRLISQEIKKHIDEMVTSQIGKFISSNKDWIEEILDRAEFRQKIADISELKKRQKKKKGKLAKLIDCYTKDRSKAAIAFSEGDCMASSTMVKVLDGTKMLSDLVPGDLVMTHTGEFKPVVVNESVEKAGIVLITEIGEIVVSETHRHPVFNIETGNIEILETIELDHKKHKLLQAKF